MALKGKGKGKKDGMRAEGCHQREEGAGGDILVARE